MKEQPFDILVNGRPQMTVWAKDSGTAIIEAYILGLRVDRDDTVQAVARIH